MNLLGIALVVRNIAGCILIARSSWTRQARESFRVEVCQSAISKVLTRPHYSLEYYDHLYHVSDAVLVVSLMT